MKSIFKTAACLVAIAIAALSMQSCNSTKPIDKKELSGYWVLQSLNGEKATDVFKGPIPNLQFDTINNTIHGNAGCNIYNGIYTLNGLNEFSAPNAISTNMACMDDNKEADFLKAIGDTSILSVTNDILTFKVGEQVILEFVKGEEPKQLVGAQPVNSETLSGEWILTKLSGIPVSDIFKEKTPTITFNADGTVNGNAGCNNYRGTYKQEENNLIFGPLMSTKMMCPSIDGENQFTKILSAPVFATINGTELFLSQDGNEAMVLTKAVKE